jgi:5-methylcytosine-specific restriction endonuclease McrA
MTRVNEKVPYTEDYLATLKSQAWRELKERKQEECGFACEICETPSDRLELHHRHYRSIGKEKTTDVQLLCRQCHETEDQKRIHARFRQRYRAINTYALKRWGRGWERIISFPEAADEFDAWLTWKKKRSKR